MDLIEYPYGYPLAPFFKIKMDLAGPQNFDRNLRKQPWLFRMNMRNGPGGFTTH